MASLVAAATWRAAISGRFKGRYISDTDLERGRATWSAELNRLDELLYMARNLETVYHQAEQSPVDVSLKSGEHVILVLRGSGVVELTGIRDSAQKGSEGDGPRLTTIVSPHPGTHQETFVSGPEGQRIIDSHGTSVITTHRVLYGSPTRKRAWEYRQTSQVVHSNSVAEGWAATYLTVSNRKRTSGVIYRTGFARSVRDRLLIAMAVADGTLQDLIESLEADRLLLERA